MKEIDIPGDDLDKDFVRSMKERTKSQIRPFPWTVGYVVVFIALIGGFVYSQQINTSAASKYLSLKQEYDHIDNENNKYRNELNIAHKQKKEIVSLYQQESIDLKELSRDIQLVSNETIKTQSNLPIQREKNQARLEALYVKFELINRGMKIDPLTINPKLFYYSNFEYKEGEGSGYTSNILRSIEEIKFIQDVTGFRLNSIFYRSIHSRHDIFRGSSGNTATLSLYLTDRNTRLGGFTTLNWDNDNSEVFDREALLINLDSRRIWRALPGRQSILKTKSTFHSFGEKDIVCPENEPCTVIPFLESFKRNEKEWEINGGYPTFRIYFYEIFKLLKP